jgi:hypothetical protein
MLKKPLWEDNWNQSFCAHQFADSRQGLPVQCLGRVRLFSRSAVPTLPSSGEFR